MTHRAPWCCVAGALIAGLSAAAAAPPQPARVEATVTLAQAKPGARATFTFALPSDAKGTLAGEPTVTSHVGSAAVVPKSASKTGCRFTWNVASARKAAPILRGTDFRIDWRLKTGDGKKDATHAYVTAVFVTLAANGAVTLSEVQTTPAPVNTARRIIGPVVEYQFTKAVAGALVRATRTRGNATTSIRINLLNGLRLTKQPQVKHSIGQVRRRTWNARRVNTYDYVYWSPPKALPKKDTVGRMVFSWVAAPAGKGDGKTGGKTGAVTLHIKVTKTGAMSITRVESKAATTTKPVKPEAD